MKSATLKCLLLGLLFTLSACTNKDIIPKKDMVEILKKMYLTDGVINAVNNKKLFAKDTISYYEPILKQYGYSKEQFDSSLKYYAQKTETLDKMMDEVIIELTQMDDRVDIQHTIQDSAIADSLNLWPLKTTWNMAVDYILDPALGFEIPLKGQGEYCLSYDSQIFPDDSSTNCKLSIFFYLDDKTPSGVRTNRIFHTYKKDGKIYHHTFTLKLENTLATHLKGWIYDNSNGNNKINRHAFFSNLRVIYKPANVIKKPKQLKPPKNIPVKNLKPKKFVKPVER